MNTIIDPPEEGQVPAPAPAPAPVPERPSLSWSDPKMANLFFVNLRTLIADVQGAAEDQLLPRRERRLGHLEAERILVESFKGIDELLSFMERTVPPPEIDKD
jgi:hypothetical protein